MEKDQTLLFADDSVPITAKTEMSVQAPITL